MRPRTRRVALVPSEALKPQMAGIGIRYLELARRLPFHGLDVVLVTPGEPGDVPESAAVDVRRFERGSLAQLLDDCQVVITQGQLANDVVLEIRDKPVVVDFYDPFLIENFAYVPTLGLDPYRNDHATWVLQLSRGDFFLCSSDEQRQFYLGFLTALGRVNPHRLAGDPDLEGLISAVPFGVPDELPEYRPYLDEPLGKRGEGEKRLLFGGLYDWYDPWPVLKALERCRENPWTLLLIRNPNPGTPQKLFAEVEDWCRRQGLWGKRVKVLDWVPSERRYDLLRDVDLMIATHRLSLETRLSLRTRFLDALAAGCPVVTSEGGAMSRLLVEENAGWVVPEGDTEAVVEALHQALAPPAETSSSELRTAKRAGASRLVDRFAWDRVLEPLVIFCHEAEIDLTKDDFASHPATQAPADPLLFRVRRRLRRAFGS